MVSTLWAALLVAGMEALLVQWTSFTVPPKLLALDFVVTAAVIGAVVFPVAAALRSAARRFATPALALVLATATFDLSRIRTEKLSLAQPAALAVLFVLLAGGFALLRRGPQGRSSLRSEVVVGHLLLAATAAAWIALHLGGRFVSTGVALALLGVTTAAQLACAVPLAALAESRGRGPGGAMLASVAVLAAAAALSYPIAPGIFSPQIGEDGSAQPPAGLPNVIVVVLDTVRADHLSLYGYEKPTSPELSKFAAGADVFRRAIANSNWSLPSHATLLTGLLPHQHGARTAIAVPAVPNADNPRAVEITQQPLREDRPTLATSLHAIGYDVGAVSANYAWVSASSGLLRGFQYIDDAPAALVRWEPFSGAYVRHLPLQRLRNRYVRWMSTRRAADRIVDDAANFLDRPRRGPFFLLLNFMDGHSPYRSSLQGDDVPEIRERFRDVRWDADGLERYDRSIAFLDHQLGRFFADVRARGLFDDSLIVVTSDHGEEFGTEGGGWHGEDLSQASIHIPLVIKMPRQTTGKVLDRRAQLADVAPTILSAVGLSIPQDFFGSALGENPRGVIAESYLGSVGGRPWVPVISLDEIDRTLRTQWAIFDGQWKLVREAGRRSRLYDVFADPGESADLARERPEVAERLEQRLTTMLPAEAFTSYRLPIAKPEVSSVTLEKLKSLGYAQ